MKNKEYSKLGKLVIAGIAFSLCILKWVGILPNASISEIWTSAGWCYGIMLGTMDLNISRDSWTENKNNSEGQNEIE